MGSVDAIEALLAEAEQAHGTYEATVLQGVYDQDWPRWYAGYAVEHGVAEIDRPPHPGGPVGGAPHHELGRLPAGASRSGRVVGVLHRPTDRSRELTSARRRSHR